MLDSLKGLVIEPFKVRLQGGQVSRTKALMVSAGIGVGASVVSYKLLRSGGDGGD